MRRESGIVSRGGFIPTLLIFLFASGCASIISGKSQEMTFTSQPDGALVTVSGREIGKTPITSRLDRAKNQSVTFQKEGFKPVTMQLTTTLNGWFWGNIVLGGLIGSTTDGLSGAVYEYAPSQYYVPLVPLEEKKAIRQNDSKLFIIVNYHNLTKEIFSTPGEYTKTLFSIMNISKEEEIRAIITIRDVALTTHDIPMFAEKVTSIYRN